MGKVAKKVNETGATTDSLTATIQSSAIAIVGRPRNMGPPPIRFCGLLIKDSAARIKAAMSVELFLGLANARKHASPSVNACPVRSRARFAELESYPTNDLRSGVAVKLRVSLARSTSKRIGLPMRTSNKN